MCTSKADTRREGHGPEAKRLPYPSPGEQFGPDSSSWSSGENNHPDALSLDFSPPERGDDALLLFKSPD